jgi:hypothetical protein
MPYVPPKHCSHCGSLLEPIAGKPGQRSCRADQSRMVNYLSPVPVVAAIVEHEGHKRINVLERAEVTHQQLSSEEHLSVGNTCVRLSAVIERSV